MQHGPPTIGAMPAILNPTITDAGLAAAVNAQANGFQLTITHVALGTGKFAPEATGAGMTAMVGRKEKVTVANGVVSGTGGFRLTCRFGSWTGVPNPYDATELGFYAGDPDAGGVLFAIHSHVSDVLVQRNALDYVAAFSLQLTRVPAGSVVVEIDPDAAQSLSLIADHEGKPDPHPQYIKRSGDTMAPGAVLNLNTAPQNDDTKKAASTEFVNRVGVNFPSSGGLGAVAPLTILTAADAGRWVDAATNNGQIRLPKTTTLRVGSAIHVQCSAANVVLTATDDDVFAWPGGSGPTYPIMFGESFTLTRNAAKEWRIVNSGFRMPAGIVAYFAGNSAPAGWIKLNGVTLSRAAYPALWAYAQSTGLVVSEADWWAQSLFGRFSAGSGGSDFRVPDMRGMFLRTLDEGRGLDAGRVVGSFQEHANRSHAHALTDPGHVHTLSDPGHAHGVYDPGHYHSGYTDAQGEHRHENEVGDGFAYTGSAGVGNNGTAQGLPKGGNGFGAAWSATPWTRSAGNHQHNVTVGLNGTGIGIYGAGTGIAMQPRTTGITAQAEGSEARPRNVAWSLFLKY